MKKILNKLGYTRYLIVISISLLLTSCRLLIDIFAYPVDRPGEVYNSQVFNQSFDSLQAKNDRFILNSSNIVRYFSGNKYADEDGIYRMYYTMCDKDTLYFSVVFSSEDSLSSIHLDFFKIQTVAFNTLDYKEKKQTIKQNKELYEKGLNCYKNVFLSPLIKYIENNTIK